MIDLLEFSESFPAISWDDVYLFIHYSYILEVGWSRQQVIFFVDTNMVRQPGAHREKHWIVGESVKARFHQLDETGMV